MSNDRSRRDITSLVFLGQLMFGLAALGAGRILHYERRVMDSIAIGCIPPGALGLALSLWLARWLAHKHPEFVARQRNAMDERSAAIRHSAGNTAFWAVFTYASLYLLLSPTAWVRSIGHTPFAICTLLVMWAAYWASYVVYNRKY